MATARQTAAQRDLALVVELLRGAPGEAHRGVEFWLIVARNICARHGVRTLLNTRHADDEPGPAPAIPRPRKPVPSRSALSDVDIERLRLLADGLTINEIAETHRYSAAAVKCSLQKAYRLLGARNNVHAVALAIRANLI